MPNLSAKWSQYYPFIKVLTMMIFAHVCLDESLKQLVTETRTPIPGKPGQPERFDYQYQRNGTANLFMVTNPIEGWRTVEVTNQRTAIDYARLLKKLVDEYYPEAWMITVVQDNLNTHTPASLYKAFEPIEARRIMNRLDFCYTPKHGSWLQVRVPLRLTPTRGRT